MIDLLKSYTTTAASFEFTSKCNLRCVYCASLFADYKGEGINPKNLETIFEFLKQRNLVTIAVNGHGETTIFENWHLHCQKFLDNGFQLSITTNLAKELSDEEAEILAKFLVIDVSCDTVAPELFAKIRRGSVFTTVLNNILKIRQIAQEKKLKGPEFTFSCVVFDKNVFSLKDYVKFALSFGIKNFHFINLVKFLHADTEACNFVTHIKQMPKEQLKKIPQVFDEVIELIKKNNGTIITSEGILNVVKEIETCFSNNINLQKKTYEKINIKDKTRDCLDPWNFIFIRADSSVAYCCNTKSKLGFLKNGKNINQILNNVEIIKCRRGLLTGSLNEECLACPQKGWIGVEEFKQKVKTFLISEFERKFKVSWKGFYPLESKIQEGKSINWRWCLSKGELYLFNGSDRKVLLQLSGGFSTGSEKFSNLFIRGSLFCDKILINKTPFFYFKKFSLNPGENIIEFYSNAQAFKPVNDPRDLVFCITDPLIYFDS